MAVVMFRVPFHETLGEVKLPRCRIWTFYQDVSSNLQTPWAFMRLELYLCRLSKGVREQFMSKKWLNIFI